MLLTPFYIVNKKVFELVLRGDDTKQKNAVIQRKYKKYCIFVKNTKSAKIASAI